MQIIKNYNKERDYNNYKNCNYRDQGLLLDFTGFDINNITVYGEECISSQRASFCS